MPQSIFSDRAPQGVRVTAPPTQNRLLRRLLETNAEFLLPQIRIIRLSFNDSIYEYGDSINEVFFPLDCIVSSLAIMEDGTTIEISMTGKESVVGLSACLGGASSRHWTKMCTGGSLARLSISALEQAFISNESALKYVMRAYGSLITQVSQRAVCNARHTVLERLACWLLMIHDRVGGTNLNLTQEAIASRLGARRAGITVAAGTLQSIGAIEYRRGHLHIQDREGLERAVCECYSVMQAEYEGTKSGLHIVGASASKLSPYR